jgi:hypothetical protein
MAHFAQLNNENIIINIIVVHNNELLDENGNEIEQKGIDFCKSLFGQDTRWVQTSYNANFRKNYAYTGGTYNLELDGFIGPTPYASWILNETTCSWESPVPYPDDDKGYYWDEVTKSWIIYASRGA